MVSYHWYVETDCAISVFAIILSSVIQFFHYYWQMPMFLDLSSAHVC